MKMTYGSIENDSKVTEGSKKIDMRMNLGWQQDRIRVAQKWLKE